MKFSKNILLFLLIFAYCLDNNVSFAQNEIEGNVSVKSQNDSTSTQEDNSKDLPEFVVEGKNATIIRNGISYIPDKKIKEVSSDAYNLLIKLRIPQLSTPKSMDEPLRFINGAEISYYINGIKAIGEREKKTLSKDVERIEILTSPVDPKFGGDNYVVNIITKQYSSGGYTSLYAQQDLTLPKGQYQVATFLEKGNSTLGLSASYSWLKNQKTVSDNVSEYTMSGKNGEEYNLTNHTHESEKISQQDFEAALQWIYQIKRHRAVLILDAGISGFSNPYDFTGFSKYNLPGYENVEFTNSSHAKQMTPYLQLDFTKAFTDRDYIMATYTFGTLITSSSHTYTPTTGSSLFNETKATSVINNLRLNYQHLFNKTHSISATIEARPECFNTEYTGTANSTQKLFNFSGEASARYRLSKSLFNKKC